MTTSNNENQTEFENTINARPITETEKSYRDGYYQGKAIASDSRVEKTVVEKNNTGAGIFMGLLIAILAGFGLAALFIFNESTQPTTNPNSSEIQETIKPVTPEKETTIIEKTIEKTPVIIQPESPNKDIDTPPKNSETELKSSEVETPVNQEPESNTIQLESKP